MSQETEPRTPNPEPETLNLESLVQSICADSQVCWLLLLLCGRRALLAFLQSENHPEEGSGDAGSWTCSFQIPPTLNPKP